MGDVVVLRPEARVSSSYHLPDWPHAQRLTLSIEQARAIDRDIRHLDAVMERARDVATISTILSTIYGVEAAEDERVARAIGTWLRSGDASWRIWAAPPREK